MKKLKSYLVKLRSFTSIKTYKYPSVFVILTMVLINVIILSVSALIALSISDNYTGFIDAFVNGSLKWMLTPNAILLIEEPDILVLAVTVLIVGMVLFTGTIIALTTNIIKEYFQSKRSGSGKIYLDNHIVVLNWNPKVPELVADLMHVQEQDITVAILADVDKKYAEKQIINAINKTENNRFLMKNINVLVKKGDPLLNSDLEDISIKEAVAVIVMNKDSYEDVTKDMSKSDLNIIKTVLNVGRIHYTHKPPIVCELKRIETKEKIHTMGRVVESLQPHQIMPICFDRRLGQIIAQTIIHSYMEDVYLSMFSFDGSEVYYLEDTSFADCLLHHTDAIPLARKGDGLFVISKDDKTIYHKANKPIDGRTLQGKNYNEATSLDVYIIGRNNKLDFILSAFREYEKLYKTDFKANWIEERDIPDLVDELNKFKKRATIVLLSDETKDGESLDANVIDNLIYLEGHLEQNNVNIIVELLDPKNDKIIKDFNINNTIISNKIISLLLSKLALYPRTESFYENLLTLEINNQEKDDQEVFIRRLDELIEEPFPISFHNKKEFVISIYETFKHRVIPFGYFKKQEFYVLNEGMHQHRHFDLEAEDLIVLMKLS